MQNTLLGRFSFVLAVVGLEIMFGVASFAQTEQRASNSNPIRPPSSNRLQEVAKKTEDEKNDRIILLDNPDAKTIQQSERIRSIQKTLQLLEQRLDEANSVSEEASTLPRIPSSLPNANLNSATGQLENLQPAPISAQPAKLENTAAPEAPQPTIEQFQFSKELSVPVDALELANSLFHSGNISDALSKYEYHIENNSIAADRDLWTKCMLANCNRIEGNISEAEAIYRDIVNQKEVKYPEPELEPYPVKSSSWYLEYLSKHRAHKETFEQLTEEIETLIKTREANK